MNCRNAVIATLGYLFHQGIGSYVRASQGEGKNTLCSDSNEI